MSIKERIQELKKADALAREEAEKREAAIRLKRQREFPGAKKALAGLLEDLRGKGALSMIEEMIGEEIPSLLSTTTPTVKQPIPSLEELGSRMSTKEERERSRKIFAWKEWSAQVFYPQFLEDGRWNETLRIEVIENDRRYAYPRPLPSEPKVTVSYNLGGILTISGNGVTFSGPIPSEGERVTILEEAFARAFKDPARKQPERIGFHELDRPIGAKA